MPSSIHVNQLLEFSVNLIISGRPKNMTMLYKAFDATSIDEESLLSLTEAQEFALNVSNSFQINVIEPMLDNFPSYVQIVDFTVVSPQNTDIYLVNPVGAFGVGSSMAGDFLGNRVFMTLRSNKGHIDINRKIHHITGVHEGGQNSGELAPTIISSVQGTWTSILTTQVLGTYDSGTETYSHTFKPVCVKHVKTLKNKDDGEEYFAYDLPTAYTGWDWFWITGFIVKPNWKQFDK